MPPTRLTLKPDVDRRALIGGEQARIEHDLAVGDRDEVGRNEGREVAGVGLGDRQRGQRAAAELGRELGGALEKARVDIENVARIGLAPGRLAGQERELAMGRGVLGQIVDDHQRVAAAIAEIFADREAGERRDPLQRGGRGGRGDHEHAALGRAELAHRLDHPLDRGRALADRDIDADHVRALLVDDRVDRDRRLAGGAVADDELALSASERKQRVDDQNAGLDRLGRRARGR